MLSVSASGDTAPWVPLSDFFFYSLFFAIFSTKRLEACSSLTTYFSAQIKSYKIFRDVVEI